MKWLAIGCVVSGLVILQVAVGIAFHSGTKTVPTDMICILPEKEK